MSTDNAKIVQIPSLPEYGFRELKDFIRKNTYKGFIITAAGLILLLLLYFGYTMYAERAKANVQASQVVSKMTIETLPEEHDNDDVKDAAPTQQVQIDYGTASIAGTPIAVPDAEIKVQVEFAGLADMDQAMATQGTVSLDGAIDFQVTDQPVVYTPPVDNEAIPDEKEFVAVEKEPGFDYGELQSRVRYPENAQRLGIEGKVLVRTYIDKNGKPTRTKVIESPSRMLDQAAIDAVNKTVFTPAINNGTNVGIWFEIPITFAIKK